MTMSLSLRRLPIRLWCTSTRNRSGLATWKIPRAHSRFDSQTKSTRWGGSSTKTDTTTATARNGKIIGSFQNGGGNDKESSVREMATWAKVRPLRVRMITMDITGTIVSFRGSLEKHYLGAAAKCGIIVEDSQAPQDSFETEAGEIGIPPRRKLNINDAFHRAYKETSTMYPCFGGDILTAKQWWRVCVSKSFEYAGIKMDDPTQDLVFQRIYSTFGSNAAYEIFPDALPFLKWARRRGLICGVLSNADERYGDSILPMLGLTHDELQFQCFSKDLKIEKPDSRFFTAAIQRGEQVLSTIHRISDQDDYDPILPSQVLHIGNDFQKDFEGARRVGIHSCLLNRYHEDDSAEEWKRRGAPVFADLLDVVEYLGNSNCRLG